MAIAKLPELERSITFYGEEFYDLCDSLILLFSVTDSWISSLSAFSSLDYSIYLIIYIGTYMVTSFSLTTSTIISFIISFGWISAVASWSLHSGLTFDKFI